MNKTLNFKIGDVVRLISLAEGMVDTTLISKEFIVDQMLPENRSPYLIVDEYSEYGFVVRDINLELVVEKVNTITVVSTLPHNFWPVQNFNV